MNETGRRELGVLVTTHPEASVSARTPTAAPAPVHVTETAPTSSPATALVPESSPAPTTAPNPAQLSSHSRHLHNIPGSTKTYIPFF